MNLKAQPQATLHRRHRYAGESTAGDDWLVWLDCGWIVAPVQVGRRERRNVTKLAWGS
jgi:hypothetical protein